MEEHWEAYPCAMGEGQAFILVNVGIGEMLENNIPQTLLRTRLYFNEPDENGMPPQHEYEMVDELEEELTEFVGKNGDHFVGRITVGGERLCFIYVNDDDKYPPVLKELAEQYDFSMDSAVRDDEGHQMYWDFLYPSTTDWRVISDMKVVDALIEHNDDPSQPRPVEHWAYFSDQPSAEQFAKWAVENDFQFDKPIELEQDQHSVRLKHTGTMHLDDLCSRTIPLAEKAEELGGKYDGWETVIVNGEGNEPLNFVED